MKSVKELPVIMPKRSEQHEENKILSFAAYLLTVEVSLTFSIFIVVFYISHHVARRTLSCIHWIAKSEIGA